MKIITAFPEISLRSDKWLEQINTNFKGLLAQDKKAKEAGTLVGRFISEPVADGKAYYVIVKENRKSVRIRLATGFGDDYHIRYWGAEATIDREYVKREIKGREGLDALANTHKGV